MHYCTFYCYFYIISMPFFFLVQMQQATTIELFRLYMTIQPPTLFSCCPLFSQTRCTWKPRSKTSRPIRYLWSVLHWNRHHSIRYAILAPNHPCKYIGICLKLSRILTSVVHMDNSSWYVICLNYKMLVTIINLGLNVLRLSIFSLSDFSKMFRKHLKMCCDL